jgi:hypothetical protein
MNHADSLQLNAALDNPYNCPKFPFVRPKTEYIEFFSAYSRSPYNAAKLYSFLVYHAQRNKPGDNPARLDTVREGGPWGERAYWWVMTRADIARACRMTEDQFRSAMAALECAGVAVHRRGRYRGAIARYNGSTVSYFRLGVCARGNGLDAWPTIEQMGQMRIILGGDKPPSIGGDKAPGLLPDTLEVSDTGEGNTQNGISGTAEPEAMHQEKANKASGEIQNPNPKVKPRLAGC